MSVTQTHVSNDFSKPVTAQTLPIHKKSILKNTNVLAPGMYKLHTYPNQTRTSQLPQDSRKTNKRVSFSTGVIPTTSVSRPQLKSNPQGDRLVEIVLFIVDSRCSKHMMGNLKLQINFVEKFLGTIKFGNDQLHPFLDMEIWKSTCLIRNLKGNDLLTGDIISSMVMASSSVSFELQNDIVVGLPKLKFVKDHLCSS
nr:hypothetical protein [Tanacetum cinerariifolium]